MRRRSQQGVVRWHDAAAARLRRAPPWLQVHVAHCHLGRVGAARVEAARRSAVGPHVLEESHRGCRREVGVRGQERRSVRALGARCSECRRESRLLRKALLLAPEARVRPQVDDKGCNVDAQRSGCDRGVLPYNILGERRILPFQLTFQSHDSSDFANQRGIERCTLRGALGKYSPERLASMSGEKAEGRDDAMRSARTRC